MTDRELLELAAKAAGLRIHVWGTPGEENIALMDAPKIPLWNPLTDDGDAMRLAVMLGLTIVPNYHVSHESAGIVVFTECYDSPDFCTPTRRAITRAAAEIGRNMK